MSPDDEITEMKKKEENDIWKTKYTKTRMNEWMDEMSKFFLDSKKEKKKKKFILNSNQITEKDGQIEIFEKKQNKQILPMKEKRENIEARPKLNEFEKTDSSQPIE